MTDISRLLDFGSRQGHRSDIDSCQFDLILCVIGSGVLDSRQQVNLSHTSLPQEISNFNSVSRNTDVDGKVTVNETHLVAESLLDTNNHVLDVGANSSDTCKLLTGCEPQVNLNNSLFHWRDVSFLVSSLFLGGETAFHHDVLEVTFKSSELSGDLDLTSLDLNFDCSAAKSTS